MAQIPGFMFGLLALLIPDEFAALIKSEIPKWAKVIKESGIKPD